jgi:hypothetical protein
MIFARPNPPPSRDRLDFSDVQARLTVTGYAPAIEVENV